MLKTNYELGPTIIIYETLDSLYFDEFYYYLPFSAVMAKSKRGFNVLIDIVKGHRIIINFSRVLSSHCMLSSCMVFFYPPTHKEV